MMRRIKNLVFPQKGGGHKIDPIQFKFFRLLLTILFAAIISIGCSSSDDDGDSGNNGGGNTTYATITGTVSGTIAVAIDENNNEVDRDTAEGTPKTFTLTVPVGGNYQFYFIENEGADDEKMFVLYWDTTNVFTISSEVTIDLGFVDTSSGIAVPNNNPLNQGSTDSGVMYSSATMSGTWIVLPETGTADDIYITADGYGDLVGVGVFNIDSPPGDYFFWPDGTFTLTFYSTSKEGDAEFSGQFSSSTLATVAGKDVTATMKKVTDISAAEGQWSGTIGTSIVSFTVNEKGIVSDFEGFAGPVTGHMYALASGEAVGFFRTGDLGDFTQILINGNLTGGFSGTFQADGDNEGVVSLTR